jgi:hypothetical protein
LQIKKQKLSAHFFCRKGENPFPALSIGVPSVQRFGGAHSTFNEPYRTAVVAASITHDIPPEKSKGPARLRNMVKLHQNDGVRVQFSVFEREISPNQQMKLNGFLVDQEEFPYFE